MSDDNLQIQTFSAAAATLTLNASVGLVVYQPAGDAYGIRLTAAATVQPTGILYSATNAGGGDCAVAMDGSIVWGIAGQAFTPTTTKWVMSSPSARLIEHTAPSTNYIVGRILPQADVASGDLVRVLVNTQTLGN